MWLCAHPGAGSVCPIWQRVPHLARAPLHMALTPRRAPCIPPTRAGRDLAPMAQRGGQILPGRLQHSAQPRSGSAVCAGCWQLLPAISGKDSDGGVGGCQPAAGSSPRWAGGPLPAAAPSPPPKPASPLPTPAVGKRCRFPGCTAAAAPQCAWLWLCAAHDSARCCWREGTLACTPASARQH